MDTLADILRWRAANEGSRLAYTFLPDGEVSRAVSLTYEELDRRARAVAGFLLERGAANRAVFLLHNDGLEFQVALAGCLYAGATAVPMYSPDRGEERCRKRLLSAHEKCDAALLLTGKDEVDAAQSTLAKADALASLAVVASDTISSNYATGFKDQKVSPEALAFLLSTSGSTGGTKLCAVPHANAIAQCRFLSSGFGYHAGSVHVGWPPVCNTGGFIFTVVNPLATGFHSVRLPPMAFLEKPYRWLAAISHYRGTHGHGPNFAYELCTARVTAEERATIDLSSWEHAINGAEPVSRNTLVRFSNTFASCGFRWGAFSLSYGLSESTMQVARSGKSDGPDFCAVDAVHLRNTGQAIEAPAHISMFIRPLPFYSGHGELSRQILIVDPDTREEKAEGYQGEIWVAGDDVCEGYLNDPEATRETFENYTADGRGPFLRTGDLGFFYRGQMCVSGRLKDIVIIRGANYSAYDFEWTALHSHETLQGGQAAAFGVVVDRQERLIVVCELAQGKSEDIADPKAVTNLVRRQIAKAQQIHAWAVVIVKHGGIPRTPNGKIQRKACRELFLQNKLPVIFQAQPHGAEAFRPAELVERYSASAQRDLKK